MSQEPDSFLSSSPASSPCLFSNFTSLILVASPACQPLSAGSTFPGKNWQSAWPSRAFLTAKCLCCSVLELHGYFFSQLVPLCRLSEGSSGLFLCTPLHPTSVPPHHHHYHGPSLSTGVKVLKPFLDKFISLCTVFWRRCYWCTCT